MITIVCGEDIVSARTYYTELLQRKKEKGTVMVTPLNAEEVITLSKGGLQDATLFETPLYVAEGLSKKVARKGSGDLYKALLTISTERSTDLLIWEGGISKRDLKLADLGTIKEFKLSTSVFSLLEQCYPSNLKTFLDQFGQLIQPQSEIFIHIMLTRHIRSLLAVKFGTQLPSYQAWMGGKLKGQAAKWDEQKLLDFYEKLLNIEVQLKTGKGVYPVGKSISALSCYYL